MQPERAVADQDEPSVLAYIGTYTNSPLHVRGNGEGIYVCRLDSRSGALIPAGLTARAVNPSFLALHPEHRYLYAVVEVGGPDGQLHGSVSAFSLDPVTGALRFLNQRPSGGDGPCHLSVDRTGRLALVANYQSGSVAVLPIGDNGQLGEPAQVVQHRGSSLNATRQAGPHAHSITPDPSNRYALVADLGVDKLMVYKLDVGTPATSPQRSTRGRSDARRWATPCCFPPERPLRLRRQRAQLHRKRLRLRPSAGRLG